MHDGGWVVLIRAGNQNSWAWFANFEDAQSSADKFQEAVILKAEPAR